MRTLIAASIATSLMVVHASPASADIYGDAKDIIRELVERNIAKQAIPNAAAKIEMLCNYFPSSLAALQALRFNGLPEVIHKEVADAIGFRILVKIRPATAPDSSSRGRLPFYLRSSAPVMVAPAIAAESADERVATELAPLGADDRVRVNAVLQLDDTARTANSASKSRCKALFPPGADPANKEPPNFAALQSVASEALAKCVATQANFDDELACSVALTARDAAMLDEKAVQKDVQRAAVAILLKVHESTLVAAGKLAPLSQALIQALRADKLDYSLVEKLVSDQLIAGTAVDAWSTIVDLVNTQADMSLEEGLQIALTLMKNCGPCSTVVSVLESDEVKELIRFLKAKDYGGATDVAMKILVNVASPSASEEEKKALVFVRRFAVYTIDSIRSGAPSESVSADFRSAATELIEAYSGLGIHRYSFTPGGVLYPTFSLRRASRPGRGSFDTVSYPSFDFIRVTLAPKVLFREWFYASFTASALDLLNPFVELGVRSSALDRKGGPEVFLVGFLVPRVDLNIGVPALSKNVVFGAGFGVRFYRAVTTSGGMDYCVYKDCGKYMPEKDFNGDNLEYSIFVKYVP